MVGRPDSDVTSLFSRQVSGFRKVGHIWLLEEKVFMSVCVSKSEPTSEH